MLNCAAQAGWDRGCLDRRSDGVFKSCERVRRDCERSKGILTKLHSIDVPSPFGGASRLVQVIPTPYLAEVYRRKCGVDIRDSFHGHEEVYLYECTVTGYRFWRPEQIAGDEAFYRKLSQYWPNYYRTNRWEYSKARRLVKGMRRVLEVGCGRGYFLRSLQGIVDHATGLELNKEAISKKVTRFPIEAMLLEDLGAQHREAYDCVCGFQILEHVPNPYSFIEASLRCLVRGGVLVFSTPNYAHQPLIEQYDAFDLPPHHMGHFTDSIFQRIADVFNLEVVTLLQQRRSHRPEPVTDLTRKNFAYRGLRLLAAGIYELAYALAREPGPNLLAVLRKR